MLDISLLQVMKKKSHDPPSPIPELVGLVKNKQEPLLGGSSHLVRSK